MLKECFGISVNESGELVALPQLIEGYIPDLDYLPSLILTLAREVDWNEEKQCFKNVATVSLNTIPVLSIFVFD